MQNYGENDELCRLKVVEFTKENQEFMNNIIVKSFLEKEENMNLFIASICSTGSKNKEKLDAEFKQFYFNIRFTSFVSNTLYFNAVNYDKRYKKISKRHPLTVDKPLADEENSSFKDHIPDTSAEIKVDDLLCSSNIEDYVVDPILHAALKTISPKQKEVIDLVYVKGCSDTEIAKRLGKSQQAISKLHKKALKSIYDYIQDTGGVIYDCSGNAAMDYDTR
jgi:RNA polymerase sigma factor (sigma-70 family)